MFRGNCDYRIQKDVIEVTSIPGADYFVDPFTSVVKTGYTFRMTDIELRLVWNRAIGNLPLSALW